MPRYFIRWEIDVFDVSSKEEAAQQALEIQRNAEGLATIFSVAEVDDDGEQHGQYPPRQFTNVDVAYMDAR